MRSPLSGPPNLVFLAGGRGKGTTPLNAFDAALLDAGVADWNLVKVSSIVPPGARLLEAPPPIPPGSLVPVAYADWFSPGEAGVAAVAVAMPDDGPGVIMEVSGPMSPEEAEKRARAMAEEALRIRGKVPKIARSLAVEAQPGEAAFAGAFLWWE